jgi:hypothetical protein
MADLTALRKTIQAQLANDLGISFVAGKLPGPVEGGDLGCCYLEQVAEMAGRVEEAEFMLVVRVFKAYQQVVDKENPYDPTPLEQLAGQLQASVKAHQTGIAPAWFQRVVRIQIDPDVQGVEAQILALGANAAIL